MQHTDNQKKTVLIAGGAHGLGRALALIYARRGDRVAVADIDLSAACQTADELVQAGGQATSWTLDVTHEASWRELRRQLAAEVSKLDVMVNCAARLSVAQVGQLPLATEKITLDTCLTGTVFGCQTMVPWMIETGGGHIVNVASCAAFLGMPWSASYNAAKAGIVAYSETLYNELSAQGISVTVACPGFFPSGMFARASFGSADLRQTVQHIVSKSPLTADHIAAAIVHGVSRRRLYVMTPPAVWRLWWLKRLAPQRLLKSVGEKARRLRARFG